MSNEELISKYLADTFSIREVAEAFDPLDQEEEGTSRSILAPWSIQSISWNTGATEDEVKAFLQSNDSFSLSEVNMDGITATVARTDETLVPDKSSISMEAGANLSVSKLMNLHALQFLKSKISEKDCPVKIEDAIFDLKNTVFLPDDFMPEHLMGMVEGDADFTQEEIREEYEIVEGLSSIYFFQEQKKNGPGRIRYLYPALSGAIDGAPTNEKIRELIGNSFSSIQAEESYIDFVNSRLIKTIIFNMEQKGNRELKRPIFNPGKIKILEGMGLVETEGDKAFVKRSVSVDRLKEIYSKAKSDGQKLAQNWLSAKVEVK